MREVSYFQHFSQREDHNTNNILLALSHFYRQRPDAFAEFIGELMGKGVKVGPIFEQQVSDPAAGSRVDGLIRQEAFAIAIETKLGDDYDREQLDRHALAVDHYDTLGDGAVVLGLRRTRGGAAPTSSLAMGVRFVDLTFTDLVDALDGYTSDTDRSFSVMVDDLRRTLAAQGLLVGDELVVVPAGASIEENLATGIYYQPATRKPMDRARYVGLYVGGAVVAVGRILSIVTVDEEGLTVDPGWPEVEPLQAERVESVARGSATYGDMIARGGAHRFYVTDGFTKTTFSKATRHGVQNRRYIDLKDYGSIGGETGAQIARLLDGRSFE